MEDFFLRPIIASVIYSLLGFVILLLCYLIIEKITPEKSWKEIVENKNSALAIVLAIALIVLAKVDRLNF